MAFVFSQMEVNARNGLIIMENVQNRLSRFHEKEVEDEE